MAVPFLLVLVLLPLLALALVVVVVLAVLRRPDGDLLSTVAAARRHGTVFAALALLSGLAVAGGLAVAAVAAHQGRLLGLAPLAAATAHAVVVGAGELTWPRPAGVVRRARLRRRHLSEAAPRWLARTGLGAGALLAVVCVTTTVLGDSTGRGITRHWAHGAASASFPGGYYALPVLGALVVAGAVTWGVLALVVQRPAVVGADSPTDDALRRASAHRVVRGSTAAALFTLGGLCFVAGTGASNVQLVVRDASGAMTDVVTLGAALLVVTRVVQVAGAALLLLGPLLLAVPARPVRAGTALRQPAAGSAVPS